MTKSPRTRKTIEAEAKAAAKPKSRARTKLVPQEDIQEPPVSTESLWTRLGQQRWLFDLALILVLLFAAFLRFRGLDWDQGTHLHPDERFLTQVESAIKPVASWSEYFDTSNSTLNPNNANFDFFVYGTLPIFIVRYVAEWMSQTDYSQVHLIGRALAGSVDLLAILFVYLLGARLYDQRVALASAAFSAVAVMQIQVSHYFTVDTFLSLFTLMAIYLAVRVATGDQQHTDSYIDESGEAHTKTSPDWNVLEFILFGVTLGMAVSSKITTVFVAATLPLAMISRLYRMPEDQRWNRRFAVRGLSYLAGAAVLSLVVFRVFQPYAFNGPGFFNVGINAHWIETMKRLSDFVTGEVDWPPSIQWARRGFFFSGKNLVLWGVGIPMAVMALVGFAWVGWRMWRQPGQWQKHIIPWAWTGGYFVWQSLAFNPTMRYQLPIYPTIALFAGWALIAVWDWYQQRDHLEPDLAPALKRWVKPVAFYASLTALALTALYGFMFSNIYVQPVTRVAATQWIYQNVPGPLTLKIEQGTDTYNHPLSFPYNVAVRPEQPFNGQFDARVTGVLEQVAFNQILPAGDARTLFITIYDNDNPDMPLWSTPYDVTFSKENGFAAQPVQFIPQSPVPLTPGVSYHARIDLSPGTTNFTLRGLELRMLDDQAASQALSLVSTDTVITSSMPIEIDFSVDQNQVVTDAYGVVYLKDYAVANTQTLKIEFSDFPGFDVILANGSITVDVSGNVRGGTFVLSQPVQLVEGNRYYYRILNETAGGAVTFLGSAVTVETTWDDGLPLRWDNFDGYGGIYQRDLNLDLYSDDSQEKLERMLETLEIADYITISSSRVWASAVQIPERYPMTIEYYRLLAGCPENRGMEWCYEVAEPGKWEGQLGFDLVAVFQSDPHIGPLRINDQASEEAFTVYDHPKVFIFQKRADYDHEKVTAQLSAIDLSGVRHVTPLEAGSRRFGELLLPEARFARQQTGGTWSGLFNVENLLNSSPLITTLVWYLALALLGIALYPLVRRLLAGLPDKGYPLARTVGMLLLSYFAWLAGSVGIGFTRPVLWVLYLGLIGLGLFLGYRQRDELIVEFKARGRYFLLVETLFLGLFLLVLLIRIGNPDLWHPSKGGEKPMDFAYFNAVIKSTTFPPYDPWFAGGYINYYYYGFVFTGSFVKLLGIVPATAYNLVLPSLFAMLSIGAFSAAWNLYVGILPPQQGEDESEPRPERSAWFAGIGGAVMVAILGNLGTLRMFIHGIQRLGAYGEFSQDSGWIDKLVWTAQGLGEMLKGAGLPYGLGDWYWIPSRAIRIPGSESTQPITEFPWFTTIYADLHAHMIAMPIAMLAIGFVIAMLLGKAWRDQPRWVIPASLVLGGITIGALYPTNTWDYPTYLALACIALFYTVIRYVDLGHSLLKAYIKNQTLHRLILAVTAAVLLAMFSRLLFMPYTHWYVQGYTEISVWEGSRTPLMDYFVHWGLFLFIFSFWIGWETVEWMASTPASYLRKLSPYIGLITGALFAGFVLLVYLHIGLGVRVQWFALPFAAWAAVLLFKPGISDAKRLMLFMVGTGLFLTVFVEVVVLSGDIARMNTVFKFYLQVWLLFGVVAAAAAAYVWRSLPRWEFGWITSWQVGYAVLAAAAFLYPMYATYGKVSDRYINEAPIGLDGMAFMQFASREEESRPMLLEQDYEAIRWLQENVQGTPVIVEAQVPEYRWGSRYSIYTGLPTVLGWRWHQSQQRVPGPPNAVQERLEDVQSFYTSVSIEETLSILTEYNVEYIIVGQMERAYYPGPALEKFVRFEGQYWEKVFQTGETIIYQVMQDAVSMAVTDQ